MRSKQLANAFAVVILLLGVATYAWYIARANPSEHPPRISPSAAEKPTAYARTPGAEKPSPEDDTRPWVDKPASPAKLPGPEAVTVKVLDQPLHANGSAIQEFLFKTFANKPEEAKFSSYTTVGWQTNFAAFSVALVEKAENQKLDAVSLRKALDLVLKDSEVHLAYLPVGAYQATLNDRPVWIVTVKWESATGMGEGTSLGHIRIFVFDQQTLKQVGFATCD